MNISKTNISYKTIGVISLFFASLILVILSFGGKQTEAQTTLSSLYTISNDIRDKVVDPTVIYVRLGDNQADRLRSNPKVSKLPRQLSKLTQSIGVDTLKTSFKNVKDTSSKISRWFTFEFESESKAEQFIQEAKNLPEVEAIERDWRQDILIVPSDEFYQPGSPQSLWGHDLINAQEMWDVIENPGEGVVVGIVDTGISNTGNANDPFTHQDLVGSEWLNMGEIPNNGIDDDSNGYVDDYNGGFAAPYVYPPYADYNGHGTHVAGTIGSRSNALGLPGIAFDSTLMPVKLTNGNSWSSSITVNGFVYAVENGAQVINASIGGPSNNLTNDVVEYAFNNDVLVVAAAGNDNGTNVCTKSPGGSEYAVAVSSLDKNGNISSFSNVGTGIDVAAPGGGAGSGSSNDILSTRTRAENPGINVPPVTDSQGNEYISINGTSMATPHVTAAAAIIRQQHPDWNVEEVWAGLKWISQEPVSSDFDDGYGYGILDLSRIPDLPDTIPVAQMYEPKNCFSSNEAQNIVIKGSTYVSGNQTPSSIRIEVANGHDVTDTDFELLATLNGEVENGVLYTWEASQYPLGAYTLRVVTEFDGYSIEDRNQIAFVMYDFKTSLRMQVMKMLGFQSLVPMNPASSESFMYQSKTYYDRFLFSYNEDTDQFEPLINYPTGEFLGAIAYPGTSPSFVGNSVWYNGSYKSTTSEYFLSQPAPVFSPSFAASEALSMFDNTRAPIGIEYLMHPSLDIAEIRNLHPDEKQVLCTLGYSVEGAGGVCEQVSPFAVDDFVTFGPDDAFVCQSPPLNDLWFGQSFINNLNNMNTIRIFDFIYNQLDPEIEEVLFGSIQSYNPLCDSIVSSNPLGKFFVKIIFGDEVTSSKFARYSTFNNVSGFPNNEIRLGQEGRVIFWLCENPYNYVCNGDFEKGTPLDEIDPTGEASFLGNHLMQRLIADGWNAIGTADIFIEDANDSTIGIPTQWWGLRNIQYLSDAVDPYNTRFAGMANNTKYTAGSDHREIMITQLGKEMEVGKTYSISFESWSSEVSSQSNSNTSDPSIGNHILYVGLTTEDVRYNFLSEIIDQNTGEVNTSAFDQMVFVGDLDDYDTYNSWDTIELDFTPEVENLKNMYLVAYAEVTDMAALQNLEKHYLRYTLIDNITIEPQLPYRDIRVEKTLLSSSTTSVGEPVEFQVVVTNDSVEPIENIQVRDYLPEGFVLVDVEVPNGLTYTLIPQENYFRVEGVTLDSGESITMNVTGSFTICLAEFRNIALAYSEDYLDSTPENNFIDVFAQDFPFNEEIDNYTGFAEGVMGCAGEISGVVFYDQDQDGVQENGEYGLGGYQVSLYREVSPNVFDLEQSILTSNQNLGQYSFSSQLSGTYAVAVETVAQITFPEDSGVSIGGQSQNYILDVQNNIPLSNKNFGIYDGYTISGVVYYDENSDGQQQIGEQFVDGIEVGVYKLVNDSYLVSLDWAETNNNGEYAVDILLGEIGPDEELFLRPIIPGVLNIETITQPVFSQDGVDNIIIAQFLENSYSISSINEVENPYVFGVTTQEEPGEINQTISGVLFGDLNNNGIQNPGEDEAEGYVVNLISAVDGSVVAQVTTGVNGVYSFSSNTNGSYLVALDISNDIQTITVPNSAVQPMFGQNYFYAFDVFDGGISVSGRDFGLYFCPCGQFDLNGDCFINAGDLGTLVGYYGVNCDGNDCQADFNGDGVVDYFDSLGLLTMYSCPLSNPEYAIAGFVYQDINEDGYYNQFSPNPDTGINGAPVHLYKQQGESWVFIEEVVTTQNNNIQQPGAFLFSLDEPGEYAIVLEEGFATEALTQPIAGNLLLENSPYVQFASLSVEENTVDYNNHFGLTEDMPILTIGGYVFSDVNQNGIRESGESGLSGYGIVLLNFFGQIVDQVVTGLDGSYSIPLFESNNFILALDTSAIVEEITTPQPFNPFFGFTYLYLIDPVSPIQPERSFGLVMEDSPSPEPCGCLANLTGNTCEVDSVDIAVISSNFGCTGPDCQGDLTGDSVVNIYDLITALPWVGCPTYPWLQNQPNLFPEPELGIGFSENDLEIDSQFFIQTQTIGGYSYNYKISITNVTNGSLNNVLLENIIPEGFPMVVLEGVSSDQDVVIDKDQNSITVSQIGPGEEIFLYLTISQILL